MKYIYSIGMILLSCWAFGQGIANTGIGLQAGWGDFGPRYDVAWKYLSYPNGMPKFTNNSTEAIRVYEVGASYQPFEDVYGFHIQYARTFIFNFAFRHRLAYYT